MATVMDGQLTLKTIYEEVRKMNERLRLIEEVMEEVIIRGLPKVKLSEKEIREIKASIKEMREGGYVTPETLKGAEI